MELDEESPVAQYIVSQQTWYQGRYEAVESNFSKEPKEPNKSKKEQETKEPLKPKEEKKPLKIQLPKLKSGGK